MPEAVISETTAPCPKCRADMVLAVITPHPIATQLARHTYLCTTCNQTKTYVLPFDAPVEDAKHCLASGEERPPADGAERRSEPRDRLDAPATIYDKDG